MQNGPKKKDPWSEFQARHESRPPGGGRAAAILILTFCILLGAALGGFIGMFWNPGPRSETMERLSRDTPAVVYRRVAVGGVIGGLSGLGLYVLVLGKKE